MTWTGDLTSALRRQVRVAGQDVTLSCARDGDAKGDTDGTPVASVGRGRECVITGQPPESLLFLSGRDAVQVDFTGDDDTVAAVRAAGRRL